MPSSFLLLFCRFELVTEQIFDPDFGLWLSSVNNQMCMTINQASSKCLEKGNTMHAFFVCIYLGNHGTDTHDFFFLCCRYLLSG
jgi:hypothetical protein